MYKVPFATLLLGILAWAGCQLNGGSAQDGFARSASFRDYWYQGQAELSRYSLQQVQYGAVHPGEVVLIFVTEDFRTDTQVKLESDERDQVTSVLKLNAVRRFVTGIYDYSLYTSVFTPVDTDAFPHSLKVTMSAQDWCGQTYTQLNLREEGYRVLGHSYFEKNAEEEYTADETWLEDELWTRLRLNPNQLPTGPLSMIPATTAARLAGQKLEPQAAEGTLSSYTGTDFPGKNLRQYILKYPDAQRELRLVFESTFPYAIVGWEDTYPSRGKLLTTRASRTQLLRSDYWNHNAPGDTTLRQKLGVGR